MLVMTVPVPGNCLSLNFEMASSYMEGSGRATINNQPFPGIQVKRKLFSNILKHLRVINSKQVSSLFPNRDNHRLMTGSCKLPGGG